MTTATKKKLCWNCEGRVGFSEEHCPFCGVYLSPTPITGGDHHDDHDEQTPEPPYHVEGEEAEQPEYSSPYQEAVSDADESRSHHQGLSPEMRKMVTPMGLLLSGSIFFLFGLVLLLFSKDGKLTLQWSSDYWYVYLAFSLAMLFCGWRSLQFVDD